MRIDLRRLSRVPDAERLTLVLVAARVPQVVELIRPASACWGPGPPTMGASSARTGRQPSQPYASRLTRRRKPAPTVGSMTDGIGGSASARGRMRVAPGETDHPEKHRRHGGNTTSGNGMAVAMAAP